MKIGMLNKLLDELGKFLRTRDGFQTSLIQEVRGLFEGYDKSMLSTLAATVERWRAGRHPGETSPPLRDLQTLLQECGGLLQAAGAKAAAADMQIVATFFDGCTHDTVPAFIADVRSTLARKKSHKARSSTSSSSHRERSKTPTNELRIDLVRSYADRLTAANDDNDAFDEIAARLEADKKVRLQEMSAIATRYLGHDPRRKNKGKILQAIKDRQALDARHAAKKTGHHMTSW